MKLNRDQELDVVAGIDRCRGVLSDTYRQLFSYLAEADEAGLWLQDGCRDMAQWVAGRFGISNWHARRWVAAAHRLEHLPAIAEAFSRGELGVDKVVELTRYATPETEASLISWAKKVLPATIREAADEATRSQIDEVRKAERSRYLAWSWDMERTSLDLWGRLPAFEGMQLINAIDALASDLPTSPDAEDDLDRGDLSQDELDDICLQVSPHDYEPVRAPTCPRESCHSSTAARMRSCFSPPQANALRPSPMRPSSCTRSWLLCKETGAEHLSRAAPPSTRRPPGGSPVTAASRWSPTTAAEPSASRGRTATLRAG